MFGPTRSIDSDNLTGLERAKLERSQTGEEQGAEEYRAPPAPEPVQASRPPAPQPIKRPQTELQPLPAAGTAAHLYAGPGVKLKGEITGCDTLRIEGMVDGTVMARQLILCPGGGFLGTAEIEEAEIEGSFDGTLNVRGRLFLRGTGRIAGTLSYGQIEIERGGEIAGQITPHGSPSVSRPRAEVGAPLQSERRAPQPVASPAPVARRPVEAPAPVAQPPRPVEQAAPPVAIQAASVEAAKPRKLSFFGRD